jgi:hypothetical protein
MKRFFSFLILAIVMVMAPLCSAMTLSQDEVSALRLLPTSAAHALGDIFDRVRANPQDVPTYGVSTAIDPQFEVSVCSGALGALAMTLADGDNGAMILIGCTDATNTVTVTPANASGFTSFVFNRAGDGVLLIFDGTNWSIVAKYGLVTVTGAADFTNTQIASAAISLVTDTTLLDTTAGALAMTLADGYTGQVKKIILEDATNNATITPTHMASGTRVQLSLAGDYVEFMFDGTNWNITDLLAYRETVPVTTAGATAIPTYGGTVVLTSGGAHALTLADGDFIGHKIYVVAEAVAAGNMTLAAAGYSGPAYVAVSVVFDTIGDGCWFQWDGTDWQTFGSLNATVS